VKTSFSLKSSFLRAAFVVLVVSWFPGVGDAGEFKLSRYIEPNQMSNLLTRHVRKGLIKRVGLSESQLYLIRAAIDPHREKILEQLTEFKDVRIELVEAIAVHPFDPDRVRTAQSAASAAELELALTCGVVLEDVRPILTEVQLQEVAEMVEEVREASEIRFADFAEQLANGELMGLEPVAPSSRK
jgi:hypothetical protein